MFGIARVEIFPDGSVRRHEMRISPMLEQGQAERVSSRMNYREKNQGSSIEFIVYPIRPIVLG